MNTPPPLPPFNPHGLHGFTTIVRNGRIQHVPTYTEDTVAHLRAALVYITPHTRKAIRHHHGEYFAVITTTKDTPHAHI